MNDDKSDDAKYLWAEPILGLPRPTEDDRRRAILNLLREKSFAPGSSEILAIRQNLSRDVPPPAVDYLKPTERKFEQLRLELQALRENFWMMPPNLREAELKRLTEESKPIPLFHRYVRQLEIAVSVRDGIPSSSDSQRLRKLAGDWMLQPPSHLAGFRLQWFDKSLEPNQTILANLKNEDRELYQAVPEFSHYVKPTDPAVEERDLQATAEPVRQTVQPPPAKPRKLKLNEWFLIIGVSAIAGALILQKMNEPTAYDFKQQPIYQDVPNLYNVDYEKMMAEVQRKLDMAVNQKEMPPGNPQGLTPAALEGIKALRKMEEAKKANQTPEGKPDPYTGPKKEGP